LTARSATPKKTPEAAPISAPSCAVSRLIAGWEEESPEHACHEFEDDHRWGRVRVVSTVDRREREGEDDQAAGGEHHPGPLAGGDAPAGDRLGEDGEDHYAARHDRLDDRDGGECERDDVQQPGAGGDREPDDERSRVEQRADALPGVAVTHSR